MGFSFALITPGSPIHRNLGNPLRSEEGHEDCGVSVVLKERVEVCMALEKWEMMLELCRHLQAAVPSEVGHALDLAYAVRRFQGARSAVSVLEQARPKFPKFLTAKLARVG
jgi:hypothetical protein